MYNLRKDWEKLDKARELLEDGPMNWLDDDEQNTLYHLLDKAENNIRDVLSVKELAATKIGR